MSPSDENYDENISTLQYAKKASKVINLANNNKSASLSLKTIKGLQPENEQKIRGQQEMIQELMVRNQKLETILKGIEDEIHT